MGIFETFKLTHDKYQLKRDDLIDKFESTIGQFPSSINKKFNDVLQTPLPFGLHWHFSPEAQQTSLLLEQNEGLKTVYNRLNQQLGEETFVGEWYLVDQQAINQFADVTGDVQWIHTDPERAKTHSPFRSTIAHGFFTLALLPMLTESVNPDKNHFPEAKMVVNHGLNRVVFPFPVKVGKRIRARTRVIKLVPIKRGLDVIREVSVEIENSSRSACVAETVLRLYF
jgi:acyl dehydratase